MHDAFISYRRKKGAAVAKMLRELLKAKGVTAYMDLDELRSGTFNDKLLTAIENCPSFILVLSPGSLDRCEEKGDWLTKEILAAMESGRNIIPVLCDGFEWPRTWDPSLPEKLRILSNYNSVILSYHYIDASVEKIIQYVNDNGLTPAEPSDTVEPVVSPYADIDIDLFFRNRMRDMNRIDSVTFAFHAGSVWHENIDRLEILTDLADAGVKLRILVNSPEAATILGSHMRYRLKKYTPYDEAVALWKNFESIYENVEVRVCNLPMLRIYYSFHMKDPSEDAIRIKYYTYGNGRINKNFSHNFEPNDPYFELYRSEFDYLWSHSAPQETAE